MLSSKLRRVALSVAGCAFALLVAFALLHHFRHVKPVVAGDRVPSLDMTSLSGRSVVLTPLKRGVTVYNVFTTWCPSCREETPALAKLADKLRRQGVQFVGIDQGEPAAPIAAFALQFGISYPIVVDNGHLSNAVLGARVIPRTIVVKDGVVKAIAVGPITPHALETMIGTV